MAGLRDWTNGALSCALKYDGVYCQMSALLSSSDIRKLLVTCTRQQHDSCSVCKDITQGWEYHGDLKYRVLVYVGDLLEGVRG